MVRVSLDPRAARTRHPHAIALDRAVEIAAATVLLEEGVQVGEQVSIPWAGGPGAGASGVPYRKVRWSEAYVVSDLD